MSGEWRLYIVSCLENAGSCLENVGCILARVCRMQAVYWLLFGECRLYICSYLEYAGCILDPVWRMRAVYWLLCGECRLHIGSCLENAVCSLVSICVGYPQALTSCLVQSKVQVMFVTLDTQTKTNTIMTKTHNKLTL